MRSKDQDLLFLGSVQQELGARGSLAPLYPHGTFIDVLPPPTTTPPGWYDDPWQPGGKRWWDGSTWGDRAQPAQTSGPKLATGNVLALLLQCSMLAAVFLMWLMTRYKEINSWESNNDANTLGFYLYLFHLPFLYVIPYIITAVYAARCSSRLPKTPLSYSKIKTVLPIYLALLTPFVGLTMLTIGWGVLLPVPFVVYAVSLYKAYPKALSYSKASRSVYRAVIGLDKRVSGTRVSQPLAVLLTAPPHAVFLAAAADALGLPATTAAIVGLLLPVLFMYLFESKFTFVVSLEASAVLPVVIATFIGFEFDALLQVLLLMFASAFVFVVLYRHGSKQ